MNETFVSFIPANEHNTLNYILSSFILGCKGWDGK